MMAETTSGQGGAELPEETEELLRTYFDAFANLYGIVPLYRAFRIIQKQNPDLALTEERFLAAAGQAAEEEHHYIIAGAEDIYEDVKEPTPPMKREIISEYLYAVDDFESYGRLKREQEDKPFYIPEKDILLKYQDNLYFEETKEYLALGAFLRERLKLKRADDVLDDLQMAAHMEDRDPQSVIWSVERLAGRGCFSSPDQIDAFFKYYFDMCNHTRLHANRGFTPDEMRERMGGSAPDSMRFGPNIRRMLQTGEMDIGELRRGIQGADLPIPWKSGMLDDLEQIKKKEPGRNSPCPCGSGKKYKRCCGREKRS